MAEHNVNTPSRISKLLDYSQTNVRRFLSIMDEKGFVTLKERGVFEINDPLFRRWLEKEARK
jgi:DeoR/GlpR family transcriptional regulator of sugar metabolism